MTLKENEQEKIRNLRKQGYTYRDIIKKTHHSPTTIKKCLKPEQSVITVLRGLTPPPREIPQQPSIQSLSAPLDQNLNHSPVPPVNTASIDPLMVSTIMKIYNEGVTRITDTQNIISKNQYFRWQRAQENRKSLQESLKKLKEIEQQNHDCIRQRRLEHLERKIDNLREEQQMWEKIRQSDVKQQNEEQKHTETQEHHNDTNDLSSPDPKPTQMNTTTTNEENLSSEKQYTISDETTPESNSTNQTANPTSGVSSSYEINGITYGLAKGALEFFKTVLNMNQSEQINTTPQSTDEESITNHQELKYFIPLDENASQDSTTYKTKKKRGDDDRIWA